MGPFQLRVFCGSMGQKVISVNSCSHSLNYFCQVLHRLFEIQSRTLTWELVQTEEKQYFRSSYFGIMSLGKSSMKRVYTTLLFPHSNPCCVNRAVPGVSVCAVQPVPWHSLPLLGVRGPGGRTGSLLCPYELGPVLWNSSSVFLPPYYSEAPYFKPQVYRIFHFLPKRWPVSACLSALTSSWYLVMIQRKSVLQI